jgi:hypothetical protein
VAFDFFWHYEPFVQLSSRSTILNLFRFAGDDLKLYILQQRDFFGCSFDHIAKDLRTSCVEPTEFRVSVVTEQLEYMNEFFSLNCHIVQEYLTNAFMDILIVPCILPLFAEEGTALRTALFYLNFLIATLQSSTLAEVIVEMLTDLRQDGIALFLALLNNEMDEVRLLVLGLLHIILKDNHMNSDFRTKYSLWSWSAESDEEAALATSKLPLRQILNRCLTILSSMSRSHSLLTYLVSASLVEILVLPPIPYKLPPVKHSQFEVHFYNKTMMSSWSAQFLTILEDNQALTYQLFEKELDTRYSDLDIRRALMHPNCLTQEQSLSHSINPVFLERMASFDMVVKCWLVCYDLARKTGIITDPLPTVQKEISLGHSFAIGSVNTEIIPCLVQFSQKQRVEPPVQLYLVKNSSYLLLAKPEPHALGKCIIVVSKDFYRLQIDLLPELNAIDVNETLIMFTDHYRRHASMTHNYGFLIAEGQKQNEWGCRLIFPGSKMYSEATSWMEPSGGGQTLQEWVTTMKNILTALIQWCS